MQNRENIIDSLCENLQPVTRIKNIELIAISWTIISAIFVVLIINYFGPIRLGAIESLSSSPRFLLEAILGITAITCLSILGFRDAIPGRWTKSFMVVGVFFMVLWISQYVIGIVSPAIEISTLDKRDFCYLETLVYSLPSFLVGYSIISKLYPVDSKRSIIYISLASGMIPALYMQFACMYHAPHILLFHILPGLSMVFVGLGINRLLGMLQTR